VIVLDASALVEVVLDLPAAPWVLGQLLGQDVCAPGHQPAEVLSALARLHRGGAVDADAVDAGLREAAALDQELVPPSLLHLRRAVQLSPRVRVLDGLYVALAEERQCPLVTTDRRLTRGGVGCEVRIPPPD
jgi:predicted nucleic acid-binding protein